METVDNILFELGKAEQAHLEQLENNPYQPDVELLADYAAGRLPAGDGSVIQATLSRSEVALELVALSESGALLPAQLPDVPATLLARVMGLVGDAGSVWKVSIRLLEQGLELIRHTGTLLSSQLVPVRAGVDEAAPEHFAFEQRLGTAQAQLSVRREQTRQLSLTFSLPQGAAGMGAASAFKVELWEKERLRSVRTPQAGTVIFGQVDPGEYRLVVLEKGKKTGEVELSLLHS